ncbi:MAG: peptidylprolyl isomerase [Clostridium sp.]|nr:peptidylprolyl isomerase [Clostridium sp.]
MKRGIIKLLSIVLIFNLFILVGCAKKNEANEANKDFSNVELPIATIDVEGYGIVKAELYPEYAPNTVNNFIELANKGFYNGLTFHRVIKDFMIQGGDPEGNGAGGPGYSIKGEFPNNKFKQNTLKHTEGVISMARTSIKDSAGSQFFIMTKAASSLDGDYAAFGKVIEGMDVVHKIEEVETTKGNDKPVKDVVIKSINVDTKGNEYPSPEKIKK